MHWLKTLSAACFLLALAAPAGSAQSAPPEPVEVAISHVSGEPVPRFASLRFAAVNGRSGPSQDHPIQWRYERAGLPVLIVKETNGWRRVRDPDGYEVWMHARTLGPASSAMVQERSILRDGRENEARPVAEIEAGVIVELGACEAGACQVRHGRHEGWIDLSALWGAGLESVPGLHP